MIRNPKIALIGAGNWGKNHLRVFFELGALKTVVDLNDRVRESIMLQYPGVTAYSDYQEVLADHEIHGVVIATPVPTHYRIAKEALLAGKDVLVEKPLPQSIAEAQDLVDIAKAKKSMLMVGHLLLFKPAVQKLIECVKSGQVGNLFFVDMRRAKLGKVRRQENVLWSFATHDLAVLLEIIGSSVTNAIAMGQAVLQPQVEDNVYIHLTFGNNVQAHIQTGWMWPGDERKTIIVGSQGMLTYDEHEDKIWFLDRGVSEHLEVWDKGKTEVPFVPGDALMNEAQHFLDCIRNRKQPIVNGVKGLEVVSVLNKAEESMRQQNVNSVGVGPYSPFQNVYIHESSIIDMPIKIGAGTRIWHFSHVMAGAEIGENCNFGQNVFIGKNVKIGNNVKVQNNVSVFEGVTLENDVFCGPSMVFTNDLNPRSAYPKGARNYIPTLVKKGATIGANATILCGITIGKHAIVGAGAVVTKDVPEHAVVVGKPAEIIGWACECGKRIEDKNKETFSCICEK